MELGAWSSRADLDVLVNDDLRIGIVIRGNHGGEKRQVYAERLLGHLTTPADLFPQVFRRRLGERGEDSETAGVGNGGGELGVSNPLHAALDNGDGDAESFGKGGFEGHVGWRR